MTNISSYITAIGTAVPQYKIQQNKVSDFFSQQLELNKEQAHELKILHRASGIKYRYSVLPDFQQNKPPQFFKKKGFPKVSERMQVYREHAPKLAKEAIIKCLDKEPETSLQDITHLITVSCTGMYAPGLDIELIEQLGMPHHTQRTAINFMGCYGAFNGLKTANQICKAEPSARVLVVCVELCSIHFQDSILADDLLSCTLFADGAAAVLVKSQPNKSQSSIMMHSFFCDLFPDGKKDMSWQIGDFGFEMQLSSYVPTLLGRGIEELLHNLLKKANLQRDEIDLFAIHPGGKRILEVIEQKLNIERSKNQPAFDILKNYGNMSSATVLFVLELIMSTTIEKREHQKLLAMAFGPGLTLESGILELIPLAKQHNPINKDDFLEYPSRV